jgi:hypothetical protein
MGRGETIWGQRWRNGQATSTGLSHFLSPMVLYDSRIPSFSLTRV